MAIVGIELRSLDFYSSDSIIRGNMETYANILKMLEGSMGKNMAAYEADNWQEFVKKIPVGSRVYNAEHKELGVEVTLDGRIYNDATDQYINVTNGLWLASEVRLAK